MLIPKKYKYKKQQKGKRPNRINFGRISSSLSLNTVLLKSTQFGRISSKQLSASYQAINKQIKKYGKVCLKVFPQVPISKKPTEIRMGKGKGSVDFWVAKIQTGTTLFEIKTASSNFNQILSALRLARIRLPISTKILYI